jgi:hypothetical protein
MRDVNSGAEIHCETGLRFGIALDDNGKMLAELTTFSAAKCCQRGNEAAHIKRPFWDQDRRGKGSVMDADTLPLSSRVALLWPDRCGPVRSTGVEAVASLQIT